MAHLARTRLALAAATITIGAALPIVVAGPAAAQPQADSLGWCVGNAGAPCIVSASVKHSNGAVQQVPENDASYSVGGARAVTGREQDFLWSVQRSDSADMNPTDTWTVLIDMGGIVPRTTYTKGTAVTVARYHPANTYRVAVSGHPTRITTNDVIHDNCDTSAIPWSCRAKALSDSVFFSGDIDDFGQWTDAQQRNDFYGLDTVTNVDSTDAPPRIIGDGTDSPAQLLVDLASPYAYSNGAVIHGFYTMRVPNAFLHDMGIDDPASITSSSFGASVQGGAVGIAHPAGAVLVTATGIVFPNPAGGGMSSDIAHKRFDSQRYLRARRGSVLPGKVSRLRATRTGSTAGAVAFARASAHGSRVISYQVACSASHQPHVSASSNHLSLGVKKLAKNVTYACKVRARARAGYGHWSATVKLAARP